MTVFVHEYFGLVLVDADPYRSTRGIGSTGCDAGHNYHRNADVISPSAVMS